MEQDKQNSLISIKIKTLNHSLYEVSANLNEPVGILQTKIENKIGVPQNSQRILFRGIMLEPKKQLKEYKIQEGHVLQLIANKIPSEMSSRHSSIPTSQLARNARYSRHQLKSKRHQYLQQRLNGFKINKKQSIEVMVQSKHTIDQLMQCLNFNHSEVLPFKMDRRKLQVGEWADVKNTSGQWAEAQIINNYGQYVLVHYNGSSDRWNEWIPAQSDRIMPFRSITAQIENSQYMSPSPSLECKIGTEDNKNFECQITKFVHMLTGTLDGLSKLMKDLQFQQRSQKDLSLKNISYMSIGLQPDPIKMQPEVEVDKKQQFETPSKDHHDNLSNKCEDNISNKGDNDDISNKSFKSKRSEGLVDTSSMKSLIIDEQTRKQNKIFFDCTQAQSVCSRKNKNNDRYRYLINQEHILEEEDSQYNDQDHEEGEIMQKIALQRKMKAAQLAPLMDRIGRLLIDLAPHVALIGHIEQTTPNSQMQSLSTLTHEGSLQSKLLNQNRISSEQHSSRNLTPSCQFQIPVMLTPWQISRLNNFIEEEARQVPR